ncbi:VOC family protein [Nocardioides donggukensis]|uniref:VOC family protein n=1 Tax=Nocardioides donggukensis TaxID=2774019 RepID=A0A927Q0H6_9ACTN|nr:VOC family protein [Nocardioides donggukensis]MBD8868439.1 VOC family protein [Nocardioides donggukensis]
MTETRRVVPILTVGDIDAERTRYAEVLGLVEVMDLGWVVTLADGSGQRQVSLMTTDRTAPVNPAVSIEVDDVDAAYDAALAEGFEIVHELQDEEWGVRRFFLRDAAGNVLNVLAHRS